MFRVWERTVPFLGRQTETMLVDYLSQGSSKVRFGGPLNTTREVRACHGTSPDRGGDRTGIMCPAPVGPKDVVARLWRGSNPCQNVARWRARCVTRRAVPRAPSDKSVPSP